jgi:hypothetical protein
MKKMSGTLLLLLSAGNLLPAQVEEEPPYRLVRLTVQPAKAPVPALMYRLLPELRDTSPGNAALLYYRAFAPEWLTHQRPKVAKQLYELELKPGQPPPRAFRWVLDAPYLREVDRAARRAYCDWEMTERVRKEGIGVLLPDIQGMREFGRLLALRARFQMHDGKLNQAHYTLQTGFALSRHVSDAPMIIQSLVGNAIGQVMLVEVEEWVQRPDAPNLYWALTNLPRPFIDLRKPLGTQEAARLARDCLRNLEMAANGRGSPPEWQTKLGVVLYTARLYPRARQSLIDRGKKPEQVDRMPMAQVVLLEELYQYDRLFDEGEKLANLPYWEFRERMNAIDQEIRQTRSEVLQFNTGALMASLLLPAIGKVVESSVRFDRQIDLLRCVEAIRLYAAAHAGQLPAKLDDIKEVPIPTDPMTGKPFKYQARGNQATLYAGPPPGEEPHQRNAIKYVITLRK